MSPSLRGDPRHFGSLFFSQKSPEIRFFLNTFRGKYGFYSQGMGEKCREGRQPNVEPDRTYPRRRLASPADHAVRILRHHGADRGDDVRHAERIFPDPGPGASSRSKILSISSAMSAIVEHWGGSIALSF
jgi:hypothetical protein